MGYDLNLDGVMPAKSDSETRRGFLTCLRKWSAVVIGGVTLAGTFGQPKKAESGGWANRRGWINGGGWVNGSGKEPTSNGEGAKQDGRGWSNRRGWINGGGWVNGSG